MAEECSCDGPVESWLQNVVDAMRAALSHEFKVAIPAYDEKPRNKWIFDYSVQNTIMVSRTFFTQDVNEAFEELEEGNEDALKVSLVIDLESKLQLALPCLGARVHGPAVLLEFQGEILSVSFTHRSIWGERSKL